jgi:hypothetical protein
MTEGKEEVTMSDLVVVSRAELEALGCYEDSICTVGKELKAILASARPVVDTRRTYMSDVSGSVNMQFPAFLLMEEE